MPGQLRRSPFRQQVWIAHEPIPRIQYKTGAINKSIKLRRMFGQSTELICRIKCALGILPLITSQVNISIFSPMSSESAQTAFFLHKKKFSRLYLILCAFLRWLSVVFYVAFLFEQKADPVSMLLICLLFLFTVI